MKIVDESTDATKKLVLVIKGSRVASATKQSLGQAEVSWLVYGPQNITDAEEILNGVLELFFHAREL